MSILQVLYKNRIISANGLESSCSDKMLLKQIKKVRHRKWQELNGWFTVGCLI